MNFKRLTTSLASVGCCAMLTGCVGSVHPLYTEGETVFREELVGEYAVQLQMGAPVVGTVVSIDDEAYRLTLLHGGGEEDETYVIHLVELDADLYLDMFRAEPPRHYIARLRFEDGDPITTEINQYWLKTYLGQHPDELSVTWRDGDVMRITAETEDLQQFIIAHADDGLFAQETHWSRYDP